jgi:hypothetical protein
MKHLFKKTAALLVFFLAMGSLAAEPQKAMEPMQGGMGQHQGMGMMGGGMSDEHLRAMQEHMLMMHDYSNQILAEKDPAKKALLKNQQLELMKSHHAQMMQHGQPMKHESK